MDTGCPGPGWLAFIGGGLYSAADGDRLIDGKIPKYIHMYMNFSLMIRELRFC